MHKEQDGIVKDVDLKLNAFTMLDPYQRKSGQDMCMDTSIAKKSDNY